jgi:hypothetical protein
MMRCARARNLIELGRPGERDSGSEAELARHLSGCPDCREYLAKVEHAASRIAAVGSELPRQEDPWGLTLAIMRGIEQERQSATRGPGLFPRRSISRAALACSTAAFALCAWFFLQSYDDARKMEGLEQRLVLADRTAAERERGLDGEGRSAISRARGLLEGGTSGPVFAGEDARGLLSAFRAARWQGAPELARLQAKYPKLMSLSFDHGLDSAARGILRTEGRAFLRDVEELVRLGE